MRKALIIGIDYYEHISPLRGCVKDAMSVKTLLERHADGTVNFATPRLITCSNAAEPVTKDALKDAVRALFSGDSDIALLYFAGHGYIEDTGGYLCATDTRRGDDGLSLAEIITLASESRAKNKIIILDSCHSGIAAERNDTSRRAEISHGMTILTASTAEQLAEEDSGGGVFTNLLVDALSGSAANLVGDITPGSIYAHIDQSLGPWAQRPIFKSNVQSFVSLRRAKASIELSELQAISTHFPRPDHKIQLDPSYEPDRNSDHLANPNIPQPDPQKNVVFALLQKYVKVNLVRPVGIEHMYFAAMQSKSCELTVMGVHYQRLAAKGLI